MVSTSKMPWGVIWLLGDSNAIINLIVFLVLQQKAVWIVGIAALGSIHAPFLC